VAGPAGIGVCLNPAGPATTSKEEER